MDVTIYIAIYGAVISTIALGWNIYKQATSGPKLVGFTTNDTNAYGKQGFFSPREQGVLLRVMNRGNVETTIQHICLRSFRDRIGFARRIIFAELELGYDVKGNRPPHILSAGTEFCCWMPQEQYVGQSRATRLYFCVFHSMSDKPKYVRVWPIKDE